MAVTGTAASLPLTPHCPGLSRRAHMITVVSASVALPLLPVPSPHPHLALLHLRGHLLLRLSSSSTPRMVHMPPPPLPLLASMVALQLQQLPLRHSPTPASRLLHRPPLTPSIHRRSTPMLRHLLVLPLHSRMRSSSSSSHRRSTRSSMCSSQRRSSTHSLACSSIHNSSTHSRHSHSHSMRSSRPHSTAAPCRSTRSSTHSLCSTVHRLHRLPHLLCQATLSSPMLNLLSSSRVRTRTHSLA
mmetsp:Transcript_19823/g.43131  ORF Transcript_19823/g.43131 Transcript_19823/m.43131 type:complete len:243 (+) Transcript_19823:1171-1899(+)